MLPPPHSVIFIISFSPKRTSVQLNQIIFVLVNSLDAGSSSSPLPSTPSDPASFPDLKPNSPLPILIRATNGKSKEHRADKIKLSTIVQADQLEGFFVRYAEVCKGGMQGLKKRDRSKNKAKAKKRKGVGGGEGEKKT